MKTVSWGMDFVPRYTFRVILLLLAFGLPSCARSIPNDPSAATGPGTSPGQPPSGRQPVDLSRVAFNDDNAFLLDARWDFFWGRFLPPGAFAPGTNPEPPVPDARFAGMRPWTTPSLENKTFPGHGYGTYRMLVRLPPGHEYGFRFQQQLTAFRVYADGVLKIEAGRTGKDRPSSLPERKQHTLYVKANAEPVELVVHVSNFHMFRGGLRGILVVGRRDAIDAYSNRKTVLDLVLFGFFFGIFLYHLSFFFMHMRDVYFFVFAVISLAFALRLPFMSEKTIWLVYSSVPWDWHLRILGTLNIVSPAILMVFLRTLYPDGLSRRATLAYVFLSAIFLCVHFFEIQYLAPAMFLAYGLSFPVLVHAGWITLRMAFRGDMGALLMAVGVFFTFAFGFGAMYLNWRAEDAAPLALFVFAGSILFQALGIGRTYRDSLTARERLRERLIRSQAALSAQRKDLEVNLHDSLGGSLTDLRIVVERGMERLSPAADGPVHGFIANIRQRLDEMSRMFRGQLLFMEDMELASRDPITGLHMTLLRRYSDAGRELIFDVSEAARQPLEESMGDDNWRLDLLQLTRELCTNDLKYGRGESRWSIALHSGGRSELLLTQSNATRTPPSENRTPGRATSRARKLGGSLDVSLDQNFFSANVVLPSFRSS